MPIEEVGSQEITPATVFHANVLKLTGNVSGIGNDKNKDFIEALLDKKCHAVANFTGSFKEIHAAVTQYCQTSPNWNAYKANFKTIDKWQKENDNEEDPRKKEQNQSIIDAKRAMQKDKSADYLRMAQQLAENALEKQFIQAMALGITEMIKDQYNRKVMTTGTKFFKGDVQSHIVDVKNLHDYRDLMKLSVEVQFVEDWSTLIKDATGMFENKPIPFEVSIIICPGYEAGTNQKKRYSYFDFDSFEKKVFDKIKIPLPNGKDNMKLIEVPKGKEISFGDALRQFIRETDFIAFMIPTTKVGADDTKVKFELTDVLSPDVLREVYAKAEKEIRKQNKFNLGRYNAALKKLFSDKLAFNTEMNKYANAVKGGYMVVCESPLKGDRRGVTSVPVNRGRRAPLPLPKRDYQVQICPDEGPPPKSRAFKMSRNEADKYCGMNLAIDAKDFGSEADYVHAVETVTIGISEGTNAKGLTPAVPPGPNSLFTTVFKNTGSVAVKQQLDKQMTVSMMFEQTGLRARLAPRGVIDIVKGTVATLKDDKDKTTMKRVGLASSIVIVVDPILRCKVIDDEPVWSILVVGLSVTPGTPGKPGTQGTPGTQGAAATVKADQFRRIHPRELNFIERDLMKSYRTVKRTYAGDTQKILTKVIQTFTDDLIESRVENDSMVKILSKYPFFAKTQDVKDRLNQLMKTIPAKEREEIKKRQSPLKKSFKKRRSATIRNA